jgi:hypothetical protein
MKGQKDHDDLAGTEESHKFVTRVSRATIHERYGGTSVAFLFVSLDHEGDEDVRDTLSEQGRGNEFVFLIGENDLGSGVSRDAKL